MKYVVVSTTDKETLVKNVSKLLDEGYELYGGLIVVSYKPAQNERAVILYTQTLVKKVL